VTVNCVISGLTQKSLQEVQESRMRNMAITLNAAVCMVPPYPIVCVLAAQSEGRSHNSCAFGSASKLTEMTVTWARIASYALFEQSQS
jgi:hypothetical protein